MGTTERTPMEEGYKSMNLPMKPSSLGREVFLGVSSKTYGLKVSTKAGMSEVTLESVGIKPAVVKEITH